MKPSEPTQSSRFATGGEICIRRYVMLWFGSVLVYLILFFIMTILEALQPNHFGKIQFFLHVVYSTLWPFYSPFESYDQGTWKICLLPVISPFAWLIYLAILECLLRAHQEAIALRPPPLDANGEPIRQYVWFTPDDEEMEC